jgi:phospholipase/carboxylesterase
MVSAIRIPASKPAKAAVIFLHGLGDSGEGWSWFPRLVQQSRIITNHDEINYVFPNAPNMPITANGGYVMPGWFDIFEFGNDNAKQDIAGFMKSVDIVKSLVKEQIDNNIPPEKVIIGGFSQGAALSLATAATMDYKIGGVIALSGFCPIPSTVEEHSKSANYTTPIFQGHGTVDPLISKEWAQKTSEFYKGLGFTNYSFNTYPGVAHSADEAELADVQKFINNVLSK